MKYTFFASAAILGTWAFVLLSMTGIGLLVKQFFKNSNSDGRTILTAFWTGFAVTLALVQVWHLFFPGDGFIWVLLLPIAFAGIGVNLREIWARIQAWRPSLKSAVFGLLLAAIALRLVVSSTQEVQVYDTGLYHLQSTFWTHTYPIVPGIANLHGRLGFNSTLFVYAASLNEGPWAGRPHHVVAGPVLFMAVALAMYGASRIWESRKISPSDAFAVIILAPTTYLIHWRNYPASISPNLVSSLMVLVAGWLAVVTLTRDVRDSVATRYAAFCTALVVLAATTVKLTVAPFVCALWLLMAWWIAGQTKSWRALLSALVPMVLVSLVLLAPMLVRGVIQSGYPMYPIKVAGMDVPWRVSDEQIHMEALWVRSFSRGSFDRPTEGFEWLEDWITWIWRNEPVAIPLPFVLFLVSAILLLFLAAQRDRQGNSRCHYPAVLAMLPPALAIPVWFFTAPDPRFGSVFFWLLAAVTCATALCRLGRRWPIGTKVAILALVFALGINEASQLPQTLREATINADKRAVQQPDSPVYELGLYPLQSIEMQTFVTDHGLKLQVPRRGNQVWGAPLLSSPHPSKSLCQRHPGDSGAGFVTVGPWRPFRFPNEVTLFRQHVQQVLGEP